MTSSPYLPTDPPAPETGSTQEIYATLRRILCDFVEPDGARLRDVLGTPERLYVRAVPGSPTFPYVTMLLDRTSTEGYNSYRETGRLDVQVIGRPEAQLTTVEWIADRVDRSLLSLRVASSGFLSCRARTRTTVPQFTAPAELNVVGVRLVFDLWLWPRVLTSRLPGTA
jgi:hypothetical protein